MAAAYGIVRAAIFVDFHLFLDAKMYQILAFGANNAALASLANTPALGDENFTIQNSNFIFYEQYSMVGVYASGVSLTAAQFNDSTWNSLNTRQIYPVNLSLTPPTNPQIQDLRMNPVDIPMNEQIQVQLSNNLATGNEYEFVLIWMIPKGAIPPQPAPPAPYANTGRILAEFTWTSALTAGAWSSDSVVTVPNLIKGGTYMVVGLRIVMAHAVAYRINFPRAPLNGNRKLSPGGLVENAYGNVPMKEGSMWLGPMGIFDTTEYFQLAALGTATTGSATYTGYLDLVYLGQNLIGQGGNVPG
jgi:hypothetical protein